MRIVAVVCLLVLLVGVQAGEQLKVMQDIVTGSMMKLRDQQVNKVNSIVPGQNHFTIDRPEGTREYYVWVPQSYATSTDPVPVMLSFHGLGDNCLDFGDATGFKDQAESRNFLYVYPCSTTGLMGNAWNAGMCCLYGSSVDDVEFARLIVKQMQSNFRVDASRVYVSGFSNGGFMAEVLACQAPDVFSAVVSVSGIEEMLPGNAAGLKACDDVYANFTQRTSVLNIHGDFDFVVPWTGDAILGFPSVPDDIAAWATRNNCQGQPVQTLNNGTFTNSIYQNCESGTVIEVVKNEGGGHEWPVTDSFDTTQYTCDFFKL